MRVIPGSQVLSTSEGDGLDAIVDVHTKASDVLAMRLLICHSSGSLVEGSRRHRRIVHLELAGSEH